jgi:hypothetical protein
MTYNNRELWAAFFAILAISLFYGLAVILLDGIPGSSDLVGHLIGVVGFLMMVMTETLYSWRKRSRKAHWGRMSQWLNFHIFTGIVGPYMVLLHSAWQFNGLAGLAMLLTVLIVISGFIGRYIYTAVPRTADGVELEAMTLEGQINTVQAELRAWQESQPAMLYALADLLSLEVKPDEEGVSVTRNRGATGLAWRLRWWVAKQRLPQPMRKTASELERLARRQQTMQRQLSSLALARRSLSLWHAVHIPIGMVLFTSATIHIVAAFYYATLLR